MSALEEAALAYAQQGLHVFPLQPNGKTPLTAHGLDDATIDLMTIETWWARWPEANVAIRTGDVLVVDEDKLGAFAAFAEGLGQTVPDTRVVRTASGRHYYFQQPEGQRIRNTAGKLAEGIDTRGDGGYVVAPPSVHPSGATYRFESDQVADAVLPDWAAERLVRQGAERKPMPDIPFLGTTAYGESALKQEIDAVATAAEGTRNHTLNTAAFALGQLVAGGEVDQTDAYRSLEAAADSAGLPQVEASKTIRSGFEAGLTDPRRAPETNGVHPRPALRVVREAEKPQLQTGAMFPVEPFPTFSQNADIAYDFLVEDLWPVQSLGFIASEPKKGKTWLGLSLAISIASGSTFLGQFAVSKTRRVLYLALEGQRIALNDRVGALARGLGIEPESLDDLIMSYRPRGIDLADPIWAAELAAVANENNVELVIVDVLRNAARIKENDASEFAHFRILLEDTLRVSSVALLHHFTKLSEISKERTPAERMSGSGAMFGALDVGMFITGSEENARRLKISFDGRDIAMPDPISVYLEGDGSGPNRGLKFTDTAFWSFDIEDVKEDNVTAPPQVVAAWVRGKGGDVLMTDAVAQFKTTDDTMRKRRASLELLGIKWEAVRDGRVNRIHLIDPEIIGEGVQEAVDFTTEFTTDPNLPSGANSAETSQVHYRTDTTETEPNGSVESADLQGDFTTEPNRLSTRVDPLPSGQSTLGAESASDDDLDWS